MKEISYIRLSLQKNKSLRIFTTLLLLGLCVAEMYAGVDSTSTEFSIGVELRTRTEFRLGYRTLPADTAKAAFFTTQRTRLNFNYKIQRLRLKLAAQDIRTWGEKDLNDATATFQLFEGYAAYDFAKNVTLQLGRQEIFYDNQRLFARNNWRQSGRTHDALFMKYEKNKFQFHSGVAFNQTGEPNFGREYNGVQDKGINYKFLGILWTEKQFENWYVNSLLAMTGYEAADASNKLKMIVTHGGRVTYKNKNITLTTQAYYQVGQTVASQQIAAWYFNPEMTIKPSGKSLIKVGFEWLSGSKPGSEKLNSFNALYGVAHRFNGGLDYFTKFPDDTKNAGLMNPFVSTKFMLAKKMTLQTDIHTFFTQYQPEGVATFENKYLGTEMDVVYNYDPLPYIGLEAGYSFMLASQQLESLKKMENTKFPQWAYLQITINPTLFKWSK